MPLGCRGGRCILRKMLPLLCWRRWRSNSLAGHHLMSAACVPQDFGLKGGLLDQKPPSRAQNSPLQEEVVPGNSYRPRKSIWQQAEDMPCSSAKQNIPTSAWVALSTQNLLGDREKHFHCSTVYTPYEIYFSQCCLDGGNGLEQTAVKISLFLSIWFILLESFVLLQEKRTPSDPDITHSLLCRCYLMAHGPANMENHPQRTAWALSPVRSRDCRKTSSPPLVLRHPTLHDHV